MAKVVPLGVVVLESEVFGKVSYQRNQNGVNLAAAVQRAVALSPKTTKMGRARDR